MGVSVSITGTDMTITSAIAVLRAAEQLGVPALRVQLRIDGLFLGGAKPAAGAASNGQLDKPATEPASSGIPTRDATPKTGNPGTGGGDRAMKPGDTYLACADCDHVVNLRLADAPLIAIGRHTSAHHGRRPTADERTPRTWVATAEAQP
jgi:hypothetical protein